MSKDDNNKQKSIWPKAIIYGLILAVIAYARKALNEDPYVVANTFCIRFITYAVVSILFIAGVMWVSRKLIGR